MTRKCHPMNLKIHKNISKVCLLLISSSWWLRMRTSCWVTSRIICYALFWSISNPLVWHKEVNDIDYHFFMLFQITQIFQKYHKKKSSKNRCFGNKTGGNSLLLSFLSSSDTFYALVNFNFHFIKNYQSIKRFFILRQQFNSLC